MSDSGASLRAINAKRAGQRIVAFEKRFGATHLHLARHAAFPLALNPELLSHLWVNFRRDVHGQALNIPWVAVADVLLSGLCVEIGNELYEMHTAVRAALLRDLQADPRFGRQRMDELSTFLLSYAQQQLRSDDLDIRDFAHAQRWTARAYRHPRDAARELTLALKQGIADEDIALQLRLEAVVDTLVDTLAEPLVDFQRLLDYMRRRNAPIRGVVPADNLPIAGAAQPVQIAGISLPTLPTSAAVTMQPADIPEVAPAGTLLEYVTELDSRKFFKRTLQPPRAIIADSLVDPLFGPLFDWSFRRFKLDPSALREASLNGQAQTDLVLFNVIVALEWTPDVAYLDALKRAFEQASYLLYDVTDGYMAIGQVVVGGRELMDCADFQIFASNRFYPRSVVDGLTNLGKYQPIRLGRGLWDKQKRRTNSWDEAGPGQTEIGPQTIVHEWGHYALGMKDRYFSVDKGKFVVPAFSPVEYTIMADVKPKESSGSPSAMLTHEDTNNQDASDWEMLSQHPAYSDLGIEPTQHPTNRNQPLIPVPAFYVVGGARGNRSPLRLRWEDVVAQYPMQPEHCWVYIVKGAEITNPTGLIAQGMIEEPADYFQLLGAEAGDFVVLVGNTGAGASFQPLVLYTRIERDGQPWAWRDATPRRSEGAAFSLVDVTVTGKQPLAIDGDRIRLPRYAIRVGGFDTQWSAVTFPLGLDRVEHQQNIHNVSALEGHVMLVSRTEPYQIAIASYSIGGSPGDSGFTGHPNPLPSGSAEGNAMLFFYDARRGPIGPSVQYSGQEPDVLARHYEQFKIVTVTNPLNDAPAPGTWLPCGYAFSVTSNQSFKTLVAGQTLGGVETTDLKPTLVLYYDDKTLDDPRGDLTIGRYNAESQTWDLISAPGSKHKPRKGYLIALALDRTTAPGLFAEPPQPEHYRLFCKAAASANESA